MQTFVIVVAAGLGQRLKAKIPKALVPLKRKPLIQYCLRVFEQSSSIRGVVVVGPPGHLKTINAACAPFKKVCAIVEGGATRADSVKAGLAALPKSTDRVLVHDAARPLIDLAMLKRLTQSLGKHRAALLGVPVKATLKEVKNSVVVATPAREFFWEAQTPQGFHVDVLRKAHAQKFIGEATDDAMLVERLGIKVHMVMGSYRNIKITTPEDVLLAKSLMGDL